MKIKEVSVKESHEYNTVELVAEAEETGTELTQKILELRKYARKLVMTRLQE